MRVPQLTERLISAALIALMGGIAVGIATATDTPAAVVYATGGLVAIVGALAVPMIERRVIEAQAVRASKWLSEVVLPALEDHELARAAFAQYFAEVDSDESFPAAVKAALLSDLQGATQQLADPATAAEGRGRLRRFLLTSRLHAFAARRVRGVEDRPGADALGAVNAAVEHEQRGDLQAAEKMYASAADRGDVGGAVRLGMLFQRQGRLQEAQEAYRRADELGSAAGAARLGALLEVREESTHAEQAYRRAAQRGSPAGSARLASLLRRQGDAPAASAAARRAKELQEALSSSAEMIGHR